MEYKLSMLKWYHDSEENKCDASWEFGIDRKHVREWLDKGAQFAIQPDRVGKQEATVECRKYPLSLELDHAVLEYLLEERVAGRPVLNRDRSAKVIELAQEMSLPDSFKALAIWLKWWKRRNQVSLRCGTNDS